MALDINNLLTSLEMHHVKSFMQYTVEQQNKSFHYIQQYNLPIATELIFFVLCKNVPLNI